jgi:hypothetical protein
MSRTKHHRNQKNTKDGKDLWSRRPNSGVSLSKKNRKISTRKERSEERKMKRDAMYGLKVRGRNPGE